MSKQDSINSQLSKRTISRALTGAILLLSLLLVAELTTQFYTDSLRALVERNLQLERHLQDFSSALKDAETGQRGYLLTGEPQYLEPYLTARERANTSLKDIDRTLAAPERPAELAQLRQLMNQKFKELNKTIELHDAGHHDAAIDLVKEDTGRLLMGRISSTVLKLDARWTTEDQRQRNLGTWLYGLNSVLSVLTALGLLAIVLYLYRRLTPFIGQLIISLEEREEEIEQRALDEARRIRLIEELRQKNEELDHFAYLASHDLQEPLRTVANFVELFEEDYADDLGQEGQTYLRFISDATERMRALITRLLRYSQIGRSKGNFQEVDLRRCVENARLNLAATIGESGATLETDSLPTVQGDEIELTQLLQNLIGNAIKFTPPERVPVVRIDCTTDEEMHHVYVRDNGIGINGTARDKIFKLFSRVHTREDYQGYGIGLNFCRRIVEMHGGELRLETTSEAGSVFTFTLPVREPEAAALPLPNLGRGSVPSSSAAE